MPVGHGLDADAARSAGMTARVNRYGMAIDCECGTSVEARDEDELLDELLDHIAAAHEDGIRTDSASLIVGALAD
jgi:predicted small metal-binding protein